MVSTLAPPVPIVAGVNVFATAVAVSTVSVAFAAAVLAPAFVVVNAPDAMLLLYVPALALVTFTVTVHEPLAGIVAPERATLAPPLAAVTAPPAQVVAPDAGVALTTFAGYVSVNAVTVPPAHVVAPLALAVLTRPAGYASLNAALVAAVAFGFTSVIVITLVSFVPMVAGAKDFETVSELATVSVSLAEAALDPALV